ncbi:GNAT family N-acetyltransferase [Candidatus Gottesmanbacteria bacterium]|nr:GNAT family N-acetyltransferase [Candidatus Gottesmanbacteria bacterium]
MSGGKIFIRKPTAEDAPTMCQWGRSTRELLVRQNGDWYSIKGLREWIRNPGSDVLLVAESNSELVGMCLVSVLHEWAYCSALFVYKGYRGKGTGTKLLEEAMKHVRARGVHLFAFFVEEDNVDAQKFYEKLDFRKGFKFVWMDKKLI